MKRILISIFAVLTLCPIWAEELPANYYLRANGTQDAELKDSLKAIIRNHTAIPYGSGASSTWGVFYYSDKDEEGYCMDMYCDDWYKFSSAGTAVTGCNIEHSFAKSWWGGANNDAYKDCFHLNPSNSTANSARSNYPLGVPEKDIKTAGSLRVGKIHHDSLDVDFYVFEPKDEYKGDFARAYFYMATCYGRWSDGTVDPVCSQYNGWRVNNAQVGSMYAMQNRNYLEFQPWEQEVLIEWHRQDPVSIKEIRRQDAVSDFQHNRNPFIDYPYLAEYIWGDKAGEEVDFSQLVCSLDEAFIPGVSNGWRDGTAPSPKPKHGVTWSVNGTVLRVDSIIENKKIQVLPPTPASCSDESSEFMGWTTLPIDSALEQAPERLYTSAEEIPSITADITLYAVFAKKTVYEGGEAATYVFDMDHQEGWTVQANYSSYWLLDAGSSLVSPPVNLSGLTTITVRIRTYGGPDYNKLNISANDSVIATITTTTGTQMTEYTWTNTGNLSGAYPLVFSTNYGSGKGIGIESAIIQSTGVRVVYSDYITDCGTSDIEHVPAAEQARKILLDGRLYILVNGQFYSITGQRVK